MGFDYQRSVLLLCEATVSLSRATCLIVSTENRYSSQNPLDLALNGAGSHAWCKGRNSSQFFSELGA